MTSARDLVRLKTRLEFAAQQALVDTCGIGTLLTRQHLAGVINANLARGGVTRKVLITDSGDAPTVVANAAGSTVAVLATLSAEMVLAAKPALVIAIAIPAHTIPAIVNTSTANGAKNKGACVIF